MTDGERADEPAHASSGTDPTLAALFELAVLDRAAIVLVYFRGCTQAEVARRLAMPQREVQRRVARGLLDMGDRLRGRRDGLPGRPLT